MKGKIKTFVLPSIYALSLVIFIFSMYYIQKIVFNKLLKEDEQENLQYVDKEIIENNSYIPVITEEKVIVTPYVDKNVKILRDFYDYKKSEQEQENSIIYYENTYMQNSGVDFTSETSFDIVSILDGVVIDIKNDSILGTSVQIRHDNDIISVYQGIDNLKVKIDDKIVQGQIIAKSSKNNLNKEHNNTLHFELYYQGNIVNPTEYFNKNIKDL